MQVLVSISEMHYKCCIIETKLNAPDNFLCDFKRVCVVGGVNEMQYVRSIGVFEADGLFNYIGPDSFKLIVKMYGIFFFGRKVRLYLFFGHPKKWLQFMKVPEFSIPVEQYVYNDNCRYEYPDISPGILQCSYRLPSYLHVKWVEYEKSKIAALSF